MQQQGVFIPWVVSDITDRLDVTRIVMAQKWNEVALRIEDAPKPDIDIPCVRCEINPEEGGGYGLTQWFYEGAVGDMSKSVYEFQGSYNQEPMTSHPGIGDLMKKYGGVLFDGEIEWQPTAPEGTKGKKGLNSKGEVKDDINLMYGVQSYLAIGAVWTEQKIYALDDIPDWILNGVGFIFEGDKVPGEPPTPPGRNWLEMSPNATQRGTVMQLTRAFMLSGMGGWIPDIYNGADFKQ